MPYTEGSPYISYGSVFNHNWYDFLTISLLPKNVDYGRNNKKWFQTKILTLHNLTF